MGSDIGKCFIIYDSESVYSLFLSYYGIYNQSEPGCNVLVQDTKVIRVLDGA